MFSRLWRWMALGKLRLHYLWYKLTGRTGRVVRSYTREDGTMVTEMSNGMVIEVGTGEKVVVKVPGVGIVNIKTDGSRPK